MRREEYCRCLDKKTSTLQTESESRLCPVRETNLPRAKRAGILSPMPRSGTRHPPLCILSKKSLKRIFKKALTKAAYRGIILPFEKRRHSQAVRQRSAKPLFPGPIPGGASKKKTSPMDWFFFLDSHTPPSDLALPPMAAESGSQHSQCRWHCEIPGGASKAS